jgi:hypothetical protein
MFCLLPASFDFLLGFESDPGDGGDVYLRNVHFRRTTTLGKYNFSLMLYVED